MGVSSVDVLWVIIAATLVMSMQTGFCMLEAGLVRSKNTINVAIKNLLDFCVAAICFWAFGFALMFGASAAGWIGTSEWLFATWPTQQSVTFFLFQVMFCATSATIVSGAVAERMSFRGYLLVSAVVSSIVYPVAGHWIWNAHGWLARLGFVDFAGSTAVHSVGGWVSLAAVLILGPRIGRFSSSVPLASSHSLGTATFGVLILFVAWLGFNGGSRLALTPDVPLILLNTILGGTSGALAGLMCAWWRKGLPDLPDTLNGTIAGLVAITAPCHAVTPAASLAIGAVGGAVCFFATVALEKARIDDVVGASAAHGAGGVWGTLAVAFFGQPDKLGTGLGFWGQLGAQAAGIVAVAAWAFGGGWVLLKLIDRVQRLRVDPEHERVGLNVAEHGASTEIIDLLSEMGRHRERGEFTQGVRAEPFTEVGQIANEYNQVIAKVAAEMDLREGIAARLRVEREATDEINRKILSSIEYARRIQNAILPRTETLGQTLGDHLLIYRPRDLVSGDFYWCHRVNGSAFAAVVDCTGHGVPGAFMSMIGHALLQQLVGEQNLREPAEILAQMHVRVRDALRQDAGVDSADGMDMCLVRIDAERVVFSGARRPLWWAQPVSDGNGNGHAGIAPFGEIKGTRVSLGGGRHEKRRATFEQHVLPRSPGLTLYLATDGFADQPNHLRQPFDTSRLRTLLQSIAAAPLDEQKSRLEESLDTHRGGAAQRDDITFLGLRL
ncbi:MAG TPA: ammonium transporter [Opitutaceae bacterium]